MKSGSTPRVIRRQDQASLHAVWWKEHSARLKTVSRRSGSHKVCSMNHAGHWDDLVPSQVHSHRLSSIARILDAVLHREALSSEMPAISRPGQAIYGRPPLWLVLNKHYFVKQAIKCRVHLVEFAPWRVSTRHSLRVLWSGRKWGEFEQTWSLQTVGQQQVWHWCHPIRVIHLRGHKWWVACPMAALTNSIPNGQRLKRLDNNFFSPI